MCDVQNGDLKVWIEDFLKKRRFSKYELELTGNGVKGDGYLGDMAFVKVLTGIGKQEEKIYNLVIKSAKKSHELRKNLPLKEVFEREMFMYSQVFPAFKILQLEQNIEDPFMKFAKCYSVFNESQRQAIILQNLKHLEYDIHDRTKPQNFEHVRLVFSNYGKFHALSLALRNLRPQLFVQLTKSLTDLFTQFVVQAGMLPKMAETFCYALELVKEDDNLTYEKLKYLNQEVIEKIMYKRAEPEGEISVILHGDCWNNNMMFSYQDKSRKSPSDMMFLDFQLSSLGSPIYDLSYYLYAVADETVLKYHDLLLHTYHHSLTSFLEELGETSYQITIEDLKRHWVKYGNFGLVMAPFLIKVELSEADEVLDIADFAEEVIGPIRNSKEYQRRIKAIFRHYASIIPK